MADEIADWLSGLGLAKYAAAFAAQDIDLRALPHLTDTDLRELGVSLGHRRIILAAIAALSPSQSRAGPEKNGGPPSTEQSRPVLEPDQAERRLVSVLFCDMVGSTELARQLDPEDMRQILRDYQDRVAGAVARYGGHVAQYLGDGIMAFFGWPAAYEDQAERAVRAGLEAIAAIVALDAGSTASIRGRIAIATGQVVVGDLSSAGRQEGAIAGETPNLAARLQTYAQPGQLVISEETRSLVGAAFDITDRGALVLKGFDGAIRYHQVNGIRDVESRFDATRGQNLSRFVGRAQELALLLDKWEQAKAGEGQVVLIAGEAGIGKSRLLRTILDTIGSEAHCRWQLQCSPFHASSALFPVIQSLLRALDLGPEDTAEERVGKLEALLSETATDVRTILPVFAELLSLEMPKGLQRRDLSPQEIKALTLDSLVDRCLTMAERSPLLLVVEDAHWIDPTTRELTEHMIARIAGARVLMLVLHRPEWRVDWTSTYLHATALTLGRLPKPQIAELVKDIMGDSAGQHIVAEIASRTDGVPMFVEEVARSLVEAGPQSSSGSFQVPATLQGALVARLDGLQMASREVVQAASVMGRDFYPDVIASVCQLDRAQIDAAVDELSRARLVTPSGVAANSISFRHALIQEVTYQSLLRRKRRLLHEAVADALAASRPEIADAQPELLAYHLTEAAMPDRALPLWRRAGDRALARSANYEAVQHLEKALQVAGQLPEANGRERELLAAYLALGHAQRTASQLPDAMATYRMAVDMARTVDDTSALVTACLGFDNAEFSSSANFLTSMPLLKEAALVIGETPDSIERCELMGRLTRAYIMSGEREIAESYWRRTAAMARRLGDDRVLAEVLILGFLVPEPGYEPSRLPAVAAQLEELAATAVRHDDLDLRGRALSTCFYQWTEIGERDRMETLLDRLFELGEQRKYVLVQWIHRHGRALRAILDGDFAGAEAFAEEALELGHRFHGNQAEGVYGMQMFTIRREQARLAEVAPVIKRFIDDEPRDAAWRPGFALIACDLGFKEPARRILHELSSDGFSLSSDAKRSTTLAYLAEVCAALGDEANAATLYDRLEPYRHMMITAGVATVCYGSAGRYLGLLADVVGAWEQAEEHFDRALLMNERMRARPWLAHTKLDLAIMLRRRGRSADAARAEMLIAEAAASATELAMTALTNRLRRLYN